MAWKCRYESHVNNVVIKSVEKERGKVNKRERMSWEKKLHRPQWHTTIKPSDRKLSAHASCLHFLSPLPTSDPLWWQHKLKPSHVQWLISWRQAYWSRALCGFCFVLSLHIWFWFVWSMQRIISQKTHTCLLFFSIPASHKRWKESKVMRCGYREFIGRHLC